MKEDLLQISLPIFYYLIISHSRAPGPLIVFRKRPWHQAGTNLTSMKTNNITDTLYHDFINLHVPMRDYCGMFQIDCHSLQFAITSDFTNGSLAITIVLPALVGSSSLLEKFLHSQTCVRTRHICNDIIC